MTDPHFLHAGDRIHLGPRVTAERVTNPAIDLHNLPRIDAVLLSHYHADQSGQHAENSLRRDIPIITTSHAKTSLASKGEEPFSEVHDLEPFDSLMLDVETGPIKAVKKPALKITVMPGKRVPPGPLSVANTLLNAVRSSDWP
jgi:L-ascorbate metabolism protein UlaG (beta-lactamase superfamily)